MSAQHCPAHQEIKVNLAGINGNAFSVLGAVAWAMRRGGVSQEDITAFHAKATSGDNNRLLQTVMWTINVTMGEDKE